MFLARCNDKDRLRFEVANQLIGLKSRYELFYLSKDSLYNTYCLGSLYPVGCFPSVVNRSSLILLLSTLYERTMTTFSKNNGLMTGVGLSVWLLLLVGCSITYDDAKPSASEQAAHDREGAGVLISGVVVNSTDDSFKRLIEQNSEEDLLNACKNKGNCSTAQLETCQNSEKKIV